MTPATEHVSLSVPLRARMAHTIIANALHELGTDENAVALALENLAAVGLNLLRAVVTEALEVLDSWEKVDDDPYNVGHYVDVIPHGMIHANAEAYLDAQADTYRGLLARLVTR